MTWTKWKRASVAAAAALLVLITTAVLIGYSLLQRSLPQTSGTVYAHGLRQTVAVHRDEYGVPHIVASSEEDLMFAVGYVQAQDRLWQMDLLRRVASGRLSEIFGTKTVDVDKVLRTVGLMPVSRQIADSLSPDARRLLQSYCDGINTFIEDHKDNYPIEFVLLQYQPEPWKIENSISISRLMAFQLSMGWYVDAAYGRILDTVGYSKTQEILPRYSPDAPVIMKKPPVDRRTVFVHREDPYDEREFARLSRGEYSRLITPFVAANRDVRGWLGFEGLGVGSNAWVVSGSRSATGKPLLANDPHLGHALPSTWYEMHLVGGRFDVTGFALPGLPLIVLGNNRHVAWGFTNVQADDADFYREKLNDRGQYFFNGAWRNLRFRDEQILVRDSAEVLLRVASTHRGPLVSDVYRTIRRASDALSWRWLGHDISGETEAILGMNLARNVEEFRSSLRTFKVPGQNVVFADRDGNIAYQCMAGIPIRKNGNGIGLADGTGDLFDWKGLIPFEELPWQLNPDEGVLSSANNRTTGDWFPYLIGHYWEHPSRAARIEECLRSKERFAADDFRNIQSDLYSYHAAEVLPYVVKACETDSTFMNSTDAPKHETYLFLKHWNFVVDRESRGAAIFGVFFQRLLQNTYRDEMGEELFKSFIFLGNIPNRVTTQLLNYRNASWWDDVLTMEKEDREAIILRSLTEAMEVLGRAQGREPGGWMWENMHSITFEHPLGKQKPLDRLFNVGPFPIGGDETTINNAQYHYSDSTFKVVLGPSMRRIVDLADPEHPWSVLTLGQSGQWLSDHYADQVFLWRDVRLKRVSMEPSEFTKSRQTLTMKPPRTP